MRMRTTTEAELGAQCRSSCRRIAFGMDSTHVCGQILPNNLLHEQGYNVNTNPKAIVYGLCTFVPFVGPYLLGPREARRKRGIGGTASARYCYAVWLRHLIHAKDCGLDGIPETVAELGPGGSIGCGLAALLSGCARYYALDAVNKVSVEKSLRVFDELVALFRIRSRIPDNHEFPEIYPLLETYKFPSSILHDKLLGKALEERRIRQIRDAIAGGRMITYRAPWSDPSVIQERSVDLIYSQAVLEHVDDLSPTYRCMLHWLKPGGYVSHTIDFRSHGMSDAWNGHWACSDLLWKVIRGRRSYLINREPCSTHMELLREYGFTVRRQIATPTVSAIHRSDLSRRFRGMHDSDLTTSRVFVVAKKSIENSI